MYRVAVTAFISIFFLAVGTSAKVQDCAQQLEFKPKSKRFIKSVYNGPIRYLVPFFPLPRASQEPIRRWPQFRKIVTTTLAVALLFNGSLVANYGQYLGQKGSFHSVTEFFDRRVPLQSHQIRIISETVPIPHMAVEIDGKVYSYGQEALSVTPLRQYLLSESVEQELKRHRKPSDEPGSSSLSHPKILEKAFRLTGLDRLPRTVQMITLNLTTDEVNQMKRHLELASHSFYRNHTLAMDCATMVVLALKKATGLPLPLPVMDASPSFVMMYLALLKTMEVQSALGLPLVDEIEQVTVRENDSHIRKVFRNLYINALEVRFALTNLPLSLLIRTYLNLRYDEKDFQYLPKELAEELQTLQKDELKNLTDEASENPLAAQIQVLEEKALALGQKPKDLRDEKWTQRANELRKYLNYYLEKERDTAFENSVNPDGSQIAAIRNRYRYYIISAIQDRFEVILQTGTLPELNPGNQELILERILSAHTSISPSF